MSGDAGFGNFKVKIMKNWRKYWVLGLMLTALAVHSCASHPIKGSANDRTGTNGATNGNGKVPKAL